VIYLNTGNRRPPPRKATRLILAGLLAFLKGGVVSTLVVVPFFGVSAAIGTASAFALITVWLSERKR